MPCQGRGRLKQKKGNQMSQIYILREKDNTAKKPEWKNVGIVLYKSEALEWVKRHGARAKLRREYDAFHLHIPEHMLDEWNC